MTIIDSVRAMFTQSRAQQTWPPVSGVASEPAIAAFNTPGLSLRPTWTYLQVVPAPVAGPLPRLARGTGQTGTNGNNTSTGPAYATADYRPAPYDYSPDTQPSFSRNLPASVGVAEDGGQSLRATWRPHDVIVARIMQNSWRSSAMWEQLSFPANMRQLLRVQQARKYNLATQVAQARPLAANDYFLGYQVSQTVAADMGGSSSGLGLGQGGG